MLRAIIKKSLFIIFLIICVHISNPSFAGDNNVLKGVSIDKGSDGAFEIRLSTQKKLPSEPLLFEKGKNIYFISLPDTFYEGEKNVDVSKYEEQIKSVTINFVPYKTSKDKGYTRVVIKIADGTNLKLVDNNIVGGGDKKILFVIFGCFIAVIILAGVSYFVFKKIVENNKIKNVLDVDDVYIEDAQNLDINQDEEVLSYVEDSDSLNEDNETDIPSVSDDVVNENIIDTISIDDDIKTDDTIEDTSDLPEQKYSLNFDSANPFMQYSKDEDVSSGYVANLAKENDVVDAEISDVAVPVNESVTDDVSIAADTDVTSQPDESIVDNLLEDVDEVPLSSDNVIQAEEAHAEDASSEDTTDDNQQFYPTADEIVNDILQNDEVINEISESIKNDAYNENLTPSDSEDEDLFDEENVFDSEQQIVNNEDNNFKSVDVPLTSAGGMFTPKSLDFNITKVDDTENIQQPVQADDDYTTEADDENEVISDDILSDILQQNGEINEQKDENIDDNPYDIAGLDSLLGAVPSDDEITNFVTEEESEIQNEENFEEANDINIAEFLEESAPSVSEEEEVFSVSEQSVLDVQSNVENDENNISAENILDTEPESDKDDVSIAETQISSVEFSEEKDIEVKADEEPISSEPEEEAVEPENSSENTTEPDFDEKNQKAEDVVPEIVVNTDTFFADENPVQGANEEYYKEDNLSEADNSANNFEEVEEEQNNIDDEEPIALSQKEVADGKMLYLIRHHGEYSLIGIIGENVFVLNRFDEKPLREDILLKLNETNDEQDIYIVKVGKWRALLGVSADSMENILTLS